MRMLICLSIMAVAVGAGCDAPKIKSKPTERAGGLISQTIDTVKSAVTAIEMHDLHLFIENASAVDGRMPETKTIREYAGKENPKLGKLIDDGTIVLTGIRQREGVWAYEKDAPEKGGWVVTHNGEQKVTAEEFKRLMGK